MNGRDKKQEILKSYGINPGRLGKKLAVGAAREETRCKKLAQRQEEHDQMLQKMLKNNTSHHDTPATYERVSIEEYQNICDLLKMRYIILSCKSFSKAYIDEIKAEIEKDEELKKKIEKEDHTIINPNVLRKSKKSAQ